MVYHYIRFIKSIWANDSTVVFWQYSDTLAWKLSGLQHCELTEQTSFTALNRTVENEFQTDCDEIFHKLDPDTPGYVERENSLKNIVRHVGGLSRTLTAAGLEIEILGSESEIKERNHLKIVHLREGPFFTDDALIKELAMIVVRPTVIGRRGPDDEVVISHAVARSDESSLLDRGHLLTSLSD